MRIHFYVIGLLLLLALSASVVFFILPLPERYIDTTKINDVKYMLANDFEQIGSNDYVLPMFNDLDYCVIDDEDHVIDATKLGLAKDLNEAIARGYTIDDIERDGQVLGKVAVENRTAASARDYSNQLRIIMMLMVLGVLFVVALFYILVFNQILRPFRKLQNFAQRVAVGELDMPLQIDKNNIFGAFTESFDLMRYELKIARERVHTAEKAKQELVASLSHDIQSPLASIKATAELMAITATTDAQKDKLNVIQDKADQIFNLATELHKSVLEEHEVIKVEPISFDSKKLAALIRRSDYRKLVNMGKIPACRLRVDPSRLEQVFDNIIVNSYKYADTEIDVNAHTVEDGLIITFRDYGPGVKYDELALVTSKYFRGEGVGGKSGYGLGLFIVRKLIESMGGELECRNAQPGFIVDLWIRFDF